MIKDEGSLNVRCMFSSVLWLSLYYFLFLEYQFVCLVCREYFPLPDLRISIPRATQQRFITISSSSRTSEGRYNIAHISETCAVKGWWLDSSLKKSPVSLFTTSFEHRVILVISSFKDLTIKSTDSICPPHWRGFSWEVNCSFLSFLFSHTWSV